MNLDSLIDAGSIIQGGRYGRGAVYHVVSYLDRLFVRRVELDLLDCHWRVYSVQNLVYIRLALEIDLEWVNTGSSTFPCWTSGYC